MTPPTAKEWGKALALFVLLTVAMTWPFAARLHVIDAGDSAYFAWAVGFQVHALKTDPASLPHGNFYAPSRFTFFMDEPILGTGLLVFPLSWFTDDAIWLLNIARLLTFVLTGLFTWRLARDLGFAEEAALASGAFFAFSPIRMDQLAHVSTLGTQWIPLVFLFARRFCLAPSAIAAVQTGLFFALSFMACGYHGLFFAVLLPLSVLPFLTKGKIKEIASLGALTVVTASVFLYPIYILSRAALGPLNFVRSQVDTLKYAASIETFLAANRWNHVWGGLTEGFRGDPSNLFPGLVVVALSLLAILLYRRHPADGRDRFLLSLVVLTAAAALLALGPEIRLHGKTLAPGPFALLRDVFPVFSNLRATSRAGIFFAFGLALLAGYGLQSRRRVTAASWLAVAVFLIEARIAPIPTPSWTSVIDSREPIPAVYLWLKQQPRGVVVAELPARQAFDYARPAFHDSIYMVWSTVHFQPLVNGFAGAETPLIQRFRATAPSFPDAESLGVMRQAGVRYVLVHLRGYGPNQREQLVRAVAEMKNDLREVARFETGARPDVDQDIVFELMSGAATTPVVIGPS